MKAQLKTYDYDVKLIGGLQGRGYTNHDIDLDLIMPHPQPPNEDVFLIINQYGNEFCERYRPDRREYVFSGVAKVQVRQGRFL